MVVVLTVPMHVQHLRVRRDLLERAVRVSQRLSQLLRQSRGVDLHLAGGWVAHGRSAGPDWRLSGWWRGVGVCRGREEEGRGEQDTSAEAQRGVSQPRARRGRGACEADMTRT